MPWVEIILDYLTGSSAEYIFEDDIIVYDDDDDEHSAPHAVESISRLWEKNGTQVVIPYSFPDGMTSDQFREINKAFQEFHKKTCIR